MIDNKQLIKDLEFIAKLHQSRSESRFAKTIEEAIDRIKQIELLEQFEIPVLDVKVNDENYTESITPESTMKITPVNLDEVNCFPQELKNLALQDIEKAAEQKEKDKFTSKNKSETD